MYLYILIVCLALFLEFSVPSPNYFYASTRNLLFSDSDEREPSVLPPELQ